MSSWSGGGPDLVDAIDTVEAGKRAVGRKVVSANEPYFVGHFPGTPVMPGVLLCEALARVGAALRNQESARLTTVTRARFRRPVLPGDALRLEVTADDATDRLRGVVSAADAVVAEVDFTLAPPSGRRIHPSAVVARTAEVDEGVEISPYAVIGPHVRIGRDTWIGPHAVVDGRTTLGARNRVFQFASLGAIPQDLKYRGEDSTLEVGNDNQIREYVTMNTGTQGGGMVTRVGSGCLFMVQSHVAHDCIVGDNVILANGVALGGHVVLEAYAIVGGLAGVHQFVRVGESALCGAGSMVSQDVPPFCMVAGDRARLRGLNVLGLQRRGFADETVRALKRAYRRLFHGGSRADALAATETEFADVPEVRHLVTFIRASERGMCHR